MDFPDQYYKLDHDFIKDLDDIVDSYLQKDGKINGFEHDIENSITSNIITRIIEAFHKFKVQNRNTGINYLNLSFNKKTAMQEKMGDLLILVLVENSKNSIYGYGCLEAKKSETKIDKNQFQKYKQNENNLLIKYLVYTGEKRKINSYKYATTRTLSLGQVDIDKAFIDEDSVKIGENTFGSQIYRYLNGKDLNIVKPPSDGPTSSTHDLSAEKNLDLILKEVSQYGGLRTIQVVNNCLADSTVRKTFERFGYNEIKPKKSISKKGRKQLIMIGHE